MDTYSGTAPAEVVRAVLIVSSNHQWSAGILDIVSAFLKTPLVGPEAPRIVIQPTGSGASFDNQPSCGGLLMLYMDFERLRVYGDCIVIVC